MDRNSRLDLVSSENRTTEISAGKEVLVIVSTLIVERASPRHAGNYSCMVPGKAKTTVAVHVLNGEYVLYVHTYVIIIVFLFHLLWKGEDSVDTYQSETKFPYSQETLDQNVHYGLTILNSDCHDQMVSPFCFQSISVPSRLVVSALRQKWKSFIHIQSCISKLKQLRKGISSFARNFEVILAFKDNFYCTKEEILFYIYIFVWIQYVLLEFIWKIL